MKFFAIGLLLVTAAYAQAPLTITTTSLPAATVGSSYGVTLNATGGTAPYTWSRSGLLPPGLVLNQNGTIVGTPTTAGSYSFTIAVVDSRQASFSLIFTITVTGNTTRLVITTASALPTGAVGQPYSQTLSASGGSTPYRWTATQALPAGLNLNTSTGLISGTPTAAGSFSFAVQVTDAAQTSATATFSLTITPATLTITTVSPLFTGTVGTPYAQTFSATGGSTPYSWAVIAGGVAGLTLDATSGVLQGTPQSAGTFSITIQVTDKNNSRASQSYSLVVNPPTLTITLVSTPVSGMVGVSYSQKLPVVANGGTPPIVWSLVSGSVPGLTLDLSTLVLSGTPTTAGSYDLTLQAADSAGLSARRSLTITIAPAALSINGSRQLPDVALNGTYSQTLTASGGLPPYTWSATGLPGGLTIDPSSGTITGVASAAGNFAPAITVTDSALARATDRFTINVILPTAPSFTLSGLPDPVQPAQQIPLTLTVAAPYPAAITGQAILTFSPDSGPTDRTVVFASGGTSVNFTVAAGSTSVQTDSPLAIQTGTVAGTISISLRIQAGGLDITPVPAPAVSAHLNRAAPAISKAQFTRSGSTINVVITGYSTPREITQAVFTFTAASGQTLQPSASSITVDVGTLFNNWFQSANNTQYGSQFVLTQPFTIQGDATLVTPATVTLTNREGSTNVPITP